MGNKKITHWNMDKIDAEHADVNLIYGERSNGKSYQLKHKKAVIKYLETGKRFILMRRWKEEITATAVEQYFKDVDVEKLTNGKYNTIIMWTKKLYFGRFEVDKNGTFKTVRGSHIGYVVALSTEQNFAGASYLDVEDIISLHTHAFCHPAFSILLKTWVDDVVCVIHLCRGDNIAQKGEPYHKNSSFHKHHND